MEREPSATDICTSVTWMAHLIDRFANMRLAEDASLPAGMSFARANLLFAVHAAQTNQTSARMVDIALDLGVTGRTLTTTVDALERQGLIERIPDPSDRRAIQLALTPAGLAALPALGQAIESAASAVVSPLSSADQRTFLALVTKLIERG